jgi:hypothetical protein
MVLGLMPYRRVSRRSECRRSTKPYDSIRLTQTADLVGAISTIRVYDAGVCQ